VSIQPVANLTIAANVPAVSPVIQQVGTKLISPGTQMTIVAAGNQPVAGTAPQKIIIIQVGSSTIS